MKKPIFKYECGQLLVDHEGRTTGFRGGYYDSSPIIGEILPFGPRCYDSFDHSIRLGSWFWEERPTLAQVVSLAHGALDVLDLGLSNQEIRDRTADKSIHNARWVRDYAMGRHRLWGFTGNLVTPEGIYIRDRPTVKNIPFHMGISEISDTISDGILQIENNIFYQWNAESDSVRFVPFGFKTGELTPEDAVENAYIIGLVGQEGAEKLADIGERLGYKIILKAGSPSEDGSQHTRVSSLDIAGWYEIGSPNFHTRAIRISGDELGISDIGESDDKLEGCVYPLSRIYRIDDEDQNGGKNEQTI